MYKQPREAFETLIVTTAYRIAATLHLMPRGSTAELLNHDRSHVALTEALLYAPGFEWPPLAAKLKAKSAFTLLRKSEIQWVAGGRAAQGRVGASLLERRRLGFFLQEYVLAGELEVTKDSRLSDYLMASGTKPFQTLHNAALYPMPTQSPIASISPAQTFEFVTINLNAVSNVIEAPADDGEMGLDLTALG